MRKQPVSNIYSHLILMLKTSIVILLMITLFYTCDEPGSIIQNTPSALLFFRDYNLDSLLSKEQINDPELKTISNLRSIKFPYGQASKALYEKHFGVTDYHTMPPINFYGSHKKNLKTYNTNDLFSSAFWMPEANSDSAHLAVLNISWPEKDDFILSNKYTLDLDLLIQKKQRSVDLTVV